MFTLFHLSSLVGLVFGLIGGFHLGHRFGLSGSLGGALVGGWLGFHAGNLPFLVSTWFVHYQFRTKSISQLWGDLHSEKCLMPNMVLRELRRRGEPMADGLIVVMALLVSEDRDARCRGYTAFLSNFPELLEKMSGYNPDAPDAERHEAVGRLRS